MCMTNLFNNFPQKQIQEDSWLWYPAIGILKCTLEVFLDVDREENVSRGDVLLPANTIESELTYQNTFTNENDELRDFPQEVNDIQRKTVVISHILARARWCLPEKAYTWKLSQKPKNKTVHDMLVQLRSASLGEEHYGNFTYEL
uniref:Uncharacterized protein n=1 Tax=Glossina pallidipes TaxID=7398 RepID=A0A1B0A4A2_GLOPL